MKRFDWMFPLIIGVVIALFLMIGMTVEDQTLFIAGVPLASHFDPSRVQTALFSFLSPFGFFLPFFVVMRFAGRAYHLRRAGLLLLLILALIFLPGILGWFLKTKSFDGAILLGFAAVVLFCFNLVLWLCLFQRWIDGATLFLIWPIFWGLSEVLSYVNAYVVPYVDSVFFKIISFFSLVVPPISFMKSTLPELLSGGTLIRFDMGVCLVQLFVLFGLLSYWKVKSQSPGMGSSGQPSAS